ncbi:MAG TPA: phosphohistidine phosphatase SixA, partial [Vicinamibacterales bacterium]|nr:phosphohistidine phosphatase SixA [Vicinamibacterales bacterium]
MSAKAPMKRREAGRTRGCTLYLVRHAIAAERSDEWPDDSKRPLTHKGRARMREVVRGLVALGVEIDVVVTSPLVRAEQTAQIVVAGLTPKPILATLDALAPGHSPAAVAKALEAHSGASAIALVGHEPGMGELAAWLIGAHTAIPFKKGGVARIDVATLPPHGSGQLVWVGTPRMLRR